MAKGLCCAAQAAGDLGKPLVVTIHRKDGSTYERCGVCEVQPSCRNPGKLVFAFKFLASAACNLPTAVHCAPTAAGTAQYNAQVSAAAQAGQLSYRDVYPATFPPSGYNPPPGVPYKLPLS
jgi:hypothetical protein